MVYGIVRLMEHVEENNTIPILFYLDTVDTEHLLEPVTIIGGQYFSCDWYAQKTANGEHKLWAVAGVVRSTALTVIVDNPPRTGSIPTGTVEMTPANDPAPPRLMDAYKASWHDPVPVEGPVNMAGAEDSPFITPDGNTLYFWYNGDQTKIVQEKVYDPMTGIHVARKVDGHWQEPENIAAVNSADNEGQPFVIELFLQLIRHQDHGNILMLAESFGQLVGCTVVQETLPTPGRYEFRYYYRYETIGMLFMKCFHVSDHGAHYRT